MPIHSRLVHRPEIDGLRGIAVLAVMLFHAHTPYISGGFIGVDIFFVISGYLITRILGDQIESGDLSLARFYERRARRLLPALFVMSAISAIIAWIVLSPPALAEFGGHLIGSSLYVANVIYWIQSGYFATKSEHLPLIHTWSLAIEEQYYILFPLFLVLISKAGRWGIVAALTTITGVSLFLAHWYSQTTIHLDAAFFLLPTRAWELLAGSLLTQFECNLTSGNRRVRWRSEVLAALGLGLCLVSFLVFDAETQHPSIYTVPPVIGACLIIAFGTPQSVVGRILAIRPVVALGLISYSVYLYHQPILAFTRISLARELLAPEASLAILGAIVIGAISWIWVERPFRIPGRFSSRSIAFLSVSSTIVAAGIGYALVLSDGVPARMDSRVNAILDTLKVGGVARSEGIRLGKCHYNKDVVPDLAKFLDTWACLPTGPGPRVLVVGDSIAADKAWVLREAGYNVGNLGGAGCPLVPPNNPAEPCWQILTKARKLLYEKAVDGVVLGNNWLGVVTEADLRAIANFWREPGAQIAVFTGMPDFVDFRNRVVKNIREGVPLDSITYDQAQLEAHERSIALLGDMGFTLINSRDLLCGERSRICSAFVNGLPLVGDSTHLQPEGVRAMAKRVRQDSAWLQWYGRLN